MRKFKDIVVLGNGEDSVRLVEDLHERLEEAISILGAMQQGQYHEKKHRKERHQMEEELKDVVKDIASALGYKHFWIGKR